MLQKIYESALPRLKGKKVRDVCILRCLKSNLMHLHRDQENRPK
jgi:hypothetical protein